MTLNVSYSEERDPRTRGRQIGTLHGRQIRQTLADYGLLFEAAGLDPATVRDVADDCYQRLDEWAPDLAAELSGVAAGSDLRLREVAALNCRTEILVRGAIAGLKECTTAVWLPFGRHPHILQTWDWIPSLDNFSVLQHISPDGLSVATFAENGVLGKVGVNDAGIGLLFTLMFHTADGTVSGVPMHAVARRVLDSARSVREAIDIARSAPVTASASLTVVGWNGAAADATTVELCPTGAAEIAATDGFLLHTNHFLDPSLAAGDRLAAIGDDTLPRLAALRERTEALTIGTRTEWAHGLVSHWEDGAPLCAHPRPGAPPMDRWETKMTIGFDLGEPSMLLHEGGPCGVTADGWSRFRVPVNRAAERSLR
ncbi:MAG: C45 family autoproteolytic acyltransferase/hydrolase [Nocardioidaceae bacterium]